MEQLLMDLLAVPSVSSDREANNRALDVIAKYFADVPQAQIKVVEKNEVRSLIIATTDAKEFKVILNGHIDVVPAAESMFIPKNEGGKIYGRGASDMKGTVAAMAAAYKQLLLADSGTDIALIITSDEEIGGLNGTNYVVNELGYKAQTVFLPDSGRGDWSICTDEKGGIWYLITGAGKGAHASRPWEGNNAIEKVVQAYVEIKQQFDTQFGVPTVENNWVPTINLAAIHGGQAYNSVPDQVEMKLDCRCPAGDLDKVKAIVEPILNKYELTFTNPIVIAATHTSSEGEAMQSWCEHVQKIKKFTPEFYKTHGSSDARFFSAAGMDVIMTKSTASIIHGDEEWIELDDLEKFKNVLMDWLRVNSIVI